MLSRIRHALDRRGIFLQRHSALYGADWLRDLARFRGSDSFPMVFDVGANVGQTAKYFSERLPGATIHSFEPVASTFAELKANTAGLPRVHCHHLALSDSIGTKEIVTTGRSVEASFSSGLTGAQANSHGEQVETTTVDAFCRTHGIAAIDLLKIDVEGHEPAVLDGAAELLGGGAVGAVYAEVCFSPDNQHNAPFSAVSERLSAAGMRFLGLYEMEWFQRLPTKTSFCNALFAREPRER